MSKHLSDPVINEALDDIERFSSGIQKARAEGDYTTIAFYLGALMGTCQKVYVRNDEIDGGFARSATTTAIETK